MKAGSFVALPLIARSAHLIGQLPGFLLSFIFFSFPQRALAEKIFMNSWACLRYWLCLKSTILKAVCMGSALDKALGSGWTYTIGWVFMKGPPVWLLLLLRLLIGTLWSAIYLPFIIPTQAEAAGKSKRLSNTQTSGSFTAPSSLRTLQAQGFSPLPHQVQQN